MGISDRPYVGTFKLNNQQVVRHTPDGLVYFNGDTAIAGCATCSGRIDLQPFITSVSVDTSVNPIATTSISLQIPRQFGDPLFRDGNFLIQTGLEIHVYMRGYFPIKGLYDDVTPEETGGVDISNSTLYPYYLVFHGVITSVSHEYSGGEHTVSISGADLLHFWQYQRMSTDASLFGARPANSKVRMSLVGHNFTGMSPFGMIYTLFRDTMGAAGGVEFAMGNETTADANSTALGESLFSLSLLYWQKRFQQSLTSLRMFGADGTLYNSFQQAFLANLSSRENKDLAAPGLSDKTGATAGSWDPFTSEIEASIGGSVIEAQSSEDEAEEGGTGVNVTQLQAFSTDISNWGNVNMFESKYETKLDLANAVTEVTGFEFYQDPGGDIIYKPPFYNLDTSSSRVYRLADIDLISFSTEEGEPEATVMKGTGSFFQNVGGTGLEGEWGTRAEFIDYRMVAKYGWRQETFETSYFTDPRAIYFSAINRLDLHNIAVKSASAQIPIRPELRPGFPVYVEHLDCFYYLQGYSHNLTYGGSSTTDLQLVGKRAKFYAPGKAPEGGAKPTINNIDMSNTFLPSLPLEVKGFDQVPRLQGFPNVVMALDPELLNPLFSTVGLNLNDLNTEKGLQTLIKAALMSGVSVIKVNHDTSTGKDEKEKWLTGPYSIQVSDTQSVDVDFQTLLKQVVDLRAAQVEVTEGISQEDLDQAQADAVTAAAPIIAIVTAVQGQYRAKDSIPDADSSAAYLELLNDHKSKFNPGMDIPGYYRYYSASHPDPEQQGQRQLEVDVNTGQIVTGGLTPAGEGASVRVFGFNAATVEGGASMTSPEVNDGGVEVKAGINIMQPGTQEAAPTPTHMIHALSFARHEVDKEGKKMLLSGTSLFSFNTDSLNGATNNTFFNFAKQEAAFLEKTDPNPPVEDLMGFVYADANAALQTAIEIAIGQWETGIYSTALDATVATVIDTSLIKAALQFRDPTSFEDVLGTTANGTLIAGARLYDTFEVTDAQGNTITKPVVKGFSTDEKIAWLSGTLGCAFIAYMQDIFTQWSRLVDFQFGPEGTPPAGISELSSEAAAEAANVKRGEWLFVHFVYQEIRKGLYKSLDVGEATIPIKSKGKVPITQTVFQYSPVFPVSDERGYEVIGNYRYGRGLSIEAGGNFEKVTKASNFGLLSVASVEEVVVTLMKGGDLAKVLGSLSPVTQAEIAAGIGLETLTDLIDSEGVAGVGPETTKAFKDAFRNVYANTKQSTQKTNPTNAAYNLQRLGQHAQTDVCECKGAEADLMLLAFSEDADPQFLAVEQPDAVSEWLTSEMTAASVAWKQSQDALRGTVLDLSQSTTPDGLVTAITGGSGTNVAGQLADAVSQFDDVRFTPDDEG